MEDRFGQAKRAPLTAGVRLTAIEGTDSWKPNMKQKESTSLVAILLTIGILWQSYAIAQQREITANDKRQLGACASLGLKIIQNSKNFATEFRQLGNNWLFMPAVIDPSPKDDPHFIAGRNSMIEALGPSIPSDKNPIYLQSINHCIDWSNQFMDDKGSQPEK